MLRYLQTDFVEELRDECASLIFRLASHIRDFSPEHYPFVDALISLVPIACDLKVPDLSKALCSIAASLFDTAKSRQVGLHQAAETVVGDHRCAPVVPLLAMGMYQAILDASWGGESARRDAVLDDFRRIAQNYSDDPDVRAPFAMALYHVLIGTTDLVRRATLLDELRHLGHTGPSNAETRRWLAESLYAAVYAATEVDAAPQGDILRALLDEFRQLAGDYSDDDHPRECLARALYAVLYWAKHADDLAWRDALLEELRQLAHSDSTNVDIGWPLVWGLQFTAACAAQEGDTERFRALLEELHAAKKALDIS